jgi:beta-glucosidase/6-phospho-beta-glucosidase/beta-galactosidase
MKFYLSGKIKIWNLHDCIYLQAASDWFYSYPIGFMKLLVYIKEKYNNPVIYVTENGKLQQSSINIAT